MLARAFKTIAYQVDVINPLLQQIGLRDRPWLAAGKLRAPAAAAAAAQQAFGPKSLQALHGARSMSMARPDETMMVFPNSLGTVDRQPRKLKWPRPSQVPACRLIRS